MRQCSARGVTLVEMLVGLAVIGICVGFFYTVFFMNWQAFEHLIARADLGQEMDNVIDSFARDGRFAHTIEVNPEQTAATIKDSQGNVRATYTLTPEGRMTVLRPPSTTATVLCSKIDAVNSGFAKAGTLAVALRLTLKDQIFGKNIQLKSQVEIYPRN